MPLFLMQPTTEIYEIPHTRGNFGPTKYSQEKTLNPLNIHEKKFGTHEIPTRKNLGSTKYPQRHDGTMALDARDPRWHTNHEV